MTFQGKEWAADGGSDWSELSPDRLDELFDVLAAPRRRSVLGRLAAADGAVAFEDLVTAVARETTDEPVADVHHDVATALYHVHLPKLADAGLVADFDPEGSVTATPLVDDVPLDRPGSART